MVLPEMEEEETEGGEMEEEEEEEEEGTLPTGRVDLATSALPTHKEGQCKDH